MKEIAGHDRVIESLKWAVMHNKSAHAYMFMGRDGIGKKQVAISFAAALICPDSKGFDCSCACCSRVSSFTHPDFLFEKPERNIIRIDRIRLLQNAFKFAPVEGLARVAVIDDAHTLNKSAQNALLKILEEPPSGRYIVLVTSKPGTMLPTIKSRCRKILFSPLGNSLIEEVLLQNGIGPHVAGPAATLSGGSIRKALELSRPEYIELRTKCIHFMLEPKKTGYAGLLDLSSKIASSRDEALEFLDIAKCRVRDLLIDKFSNHDRIHKDFSQEIHSIAGKYSVTSLESVYQDLLTASRLVDSEFNVNRNLVLDVLFLNIARKLQS